MTSRRWNVFVTATFERRSGMHIGPSTLRSSFVTFLLGDDGSLGEKIDGNMREQFAHAMRHSLCQVSGTGWLPACLPAVCLHIHVLMRDVHVHVHVHTCVYYTYVIHVNERCRAKQHSIM